MAETFGSHRWYLEIDGITEGMFKEVDGLNCEIAVIEHWATGKGGNLILHKVPGAIKWSNITLKRGVTDDRKLYDWSKKCKDGLVEANRKIGTLTCYSPDMKPVAKYTFKQAWPCKYTAPTGNANSNEHAVESIEICHNGLERQQ